MAEYWKSQPKKFCDFCKCWIADNKASVDFHEKGKKHQENVKLRIQEVKKKGSERRQQQEQLNDDLAAIEEAALKAYKKDIGYSSQSKSKKLQSETLPKEELQTKDVSSSDNIGFSDPGAGNDVWNAYQTPEGYWYYYNNQTGESRWDPPEGFSFPIQQNQQAFSNNEQSSSKQNEEIKVMKDASNQNKEEDNERKDPFGKWETVAVYERNDDADAKEAISEINDKQDKVPAVKFKEKQLPVTKKNDMNDTNITFKKRKGNQDKKRSIRQRTDDS
ncbi:WW domain-binding protein 4-like [Dendronephthya gigantea]|uniref:WW domain-binding protein 4-like n=1 Tax=Dendronephthya gigantea TaxID=151771 RepID=UPI00106AB534|nr:WW domain-binding protein 4-like [Dendronephthya gigantea]